MAGCFRLQRYKLLKAIHNCWKDFWLHSIVVSDYKDTNFWKQFTTDCSSSSIPHELFQTTKIQTFESNSQPRVARTARSRGCFRLQRYKLLKAIHNCPWIRFNVTTLFQTTKIQTFSKQFTTDKYQVWKEDRLFQTTKIQTFESNSQHLLPKYSNITGCFRLQRYKLLKAFHNCLTLTGSKLLVVSDYKDTNFWKQFTTNLYMSPCPAPLFQTTKIQTFESNSQPSG